jgi:hypothetical protein
MVYDDTKPTSQSNIKTNAIISSMGFPSGSDESLSLMVESEDAVCALAHAE